MELITIGVIKKAHGNQGYVHVLPLTFDQSRFNDLKRVFLNDKRRTELKIEDVQSGDKTLRIKFKDIDDRLAAERLAQSELNIPDTEKIHLPNDVYFIHDLIGCKMMGKAGEIGHVTDVLQNSGHDLYVVKSKDDKEVLIPAISKFVKSIDIDKKEIHIEEIPGLIE